MTTVSHPIAETSGPKCFAASRIANAVKWSKRRVLSALAFSPPDGTEVVSGNNADAWSVGSFPRALREALDLKAARFGYRSIDALLSEPVQTWSPNWPISEILNDEVDYARKLQRSLRPFLQRQADLAATVGDLKDDAARTYQREFSRTLTTRHLERLIEMVIERDRGFEDWNRIEIFLPKRYSRKAVVGGHPMPRLASDVSPIFAALSGVNDPLKPTSADRSMLWRAAVETLLGNVESGMSERAAKRQILKEINLHVPGLAKSADSLKRVFNTKVEVARRDGIHAIADKRPTASGNWRAYDFSEDKLLLTKIAFHHEGNISLAHRLLHKGWTHPVEGRFYQFSSEYRERISVDLRKNKSYVPTFMREEVRGPLASTRPHALGPRAVRMARPSRLRDWSDVGVNDWHTSDDETGNSILYWVDPNGPFECEWGRFNVGRPQVLPLIDVASEQPLALIVSPTKGYSGDTIRDLVFPAWLSPEIGMPFRGCQFERGIWSSRNVEALAAWSQIDGAFADQGISLKIRHATTPRAKTIERTFGAEQNRTSIFPGYIGRGEKGVEHERVHRFIQSLKGTGQPNKEAVDPREKLWSIAQYTEALKGTLIELSKEPQNGERFRGRSPEEVWSEGIANGAKPKVLPPSLEYLLATKQVEKLVTTDGIILKIGNVRSQFCDSRPLGQLVGERVSVRFQGREPDHVVIVDPKRDPKGRSPFVVPLRKRLDAMSAAPADFERARQEEDNFASGPKALFRLISPKYNLTVQRSDFGTESLRAAGEAHRKAVEEHTAAASEKRRHGPKAARLGRDAGLDVRGVDPSTVVNALDGLTDLERRLEEREAVEFLSNPEKSHGDK